MGLDTSWTDNVPIKDIVKTGGDIAKTVSDNATRRHVSDNERAGKYDDNRRAEYQTTSNNNLAAFMGVLNTSLAIVNGLVSVVNTGINAYKDIQLSHEQVRIAQIQAAAYVESKREETHQVQIQQEQETVRYLVSLKTDLEQKRMELQKFQIELADRQEERAFSQEKWQESLNLFIYLNAEFLRQQRIKFNQENVLFLNQWCAIMRRLIYAKESGGFKTIDILEQVDDERLLTSAEGANTLKAFYNWQVHRHDAEPSFFIRGMDDKKIFVSFEDDFKAIKTAEALDEDFLELVGYSVDVHVHEFPYPEIMQSKALEDFRRSSIQNSALKECILDLSHMPFKDSGRRPRSIKNRSLLRNKNQMLAVIRSLAVENFFMIQGPPGTGKTTVIKEIIWQQLRLEPESKILVVSQANVAVDNVLRGLPPMGIPRSAIVRCGNDDKISDEMQDFSLDKQVALYREKLNEPCSVDLTPYRKIWRDMMNNSETQGFIGECLLKNFSVTGATCVGLAKKHFGLDRLSFDLVIADEVGKALPGELLLPINRAKKIIIIGDHKQLPPVIDSAFYDETKINIKDIVEDESRDKFFSTSLFEKLYETCPNDNKCMLDIQFRMPTRIGEMVSKLFYGGRLNSAPVCREKAPMFFDNNIFFLNMDDDPEYHETQDVTAEGKSGPYNESEIKITAALLKKLRENFSEQIAVITPYKNQNKKLRQRLRGELLFKRAKFHELRAQGKTVPDYCQDCWNEKISVDTCKICGRRILYSRAKLHQLREKYGSNYSPPRKCDKCK